MNKKSYITILIFVLLSLFVILFFIWPYFIEIKSRSEEFVLEKDQVSSLNMQIAELSSFKNKYNDFLINLQKIEQMVVDSQDPIAFIEFIENSATESKIDFRVSPQFSSQNDDKRIIFQLSGNGNFSDLSIFLDKLERSPYLINIKSLDIIIKRAVGENSTGELSEEIQANLLIEALSK